MKTLPYAVLGFIALLILIGLALPRQAIVEVSIRTDAEPATVFALINDFRWVNQWSTRYDSDPDVRVAYGGPSRGVGATVAWDGPLIGSGTEVIVESRPFESVVTTINPGVQGESSYRYRISSEGTTTLLTWRFEIDYGFNVLGRFMALLVKEVLHKELSDSIENLAALAESLPRSGPGEGDIASTDIRASGSGDRFDLGQEADFTIKGGIASDSYAGSGGASSRPAEWRTTSLNRPTTTAAQRLASLSDILRTDARIGPSPFNGDTRCISVLKSANACFAGAGSSSSLISSRLSW